MSNRKTTSAIDTLRLKSEDEVKILRAITQTISHTLDLKEVLNHIVDVVTLFTRADSCLLYLSDEGGRELVLRASKNLHPRIMGKVRLRSGEGITGWVAREKKTVAISRNASSDPRFKLFHNLPEDRYEAFLSVPVISKGKTIGVINVQHKHPHRHSGREIALLTNIAQQTGGAIDNARLYEDARKKAVQLETLSKVSTTIASSRYLNEILQLIVTMTAEMMKSRICSIMFLNEKADELTIEATQSLSKEYIHKPPLKVDESISGKAVKERKPIAVLDVTVEPGYEYSQIARKEGICSMLAVPMMVKDRAVGVLNSYTASQHSFTQDEIKVLQSVANQAAVAIENTKLMEKILTARENLETRKIIERAKGILMKEAGISEDKAYKTMHRKSMDTRRPMKGIAEAIVLSADMRKKLAD